MTAHVAPIASDRRFGDAAPRFFAIGLGLGLLGLGGSVVMAMMMEDGWTRFLRSYLTGFMVVTSISLGGLFFVMLQHAVRAGWSVVLRRIGECVASNLMWLWVLFIPLAIAVLMASPPAADHEHAPLYDWIFPVAHGGHLASKYSFWLTPGPWLVRAVIYLAIWAFLAWFFLKHSTAQDQDGDVRHTTRMESFCYPALILYALTQSFAAMDWIMSRESQWFSTMFPVYHFAASCCGYFAFQILTMFVLQRQGKLTAEITPEHYQDAGKLLFAFGIVFWAYIAFSQYMLIWYANIPEETPWYMARQMGGWGWVSLLLLFGHFAGPFLGIISRHPKRIAVLLAGAAAWMLLMHVIDVYWLVMPEVPIEKLEQAQSYVELAEVVANDPALVGFGPNLLDLGCILGFLGLLAAGTAKRMGGVALIPERDPRLHESLAFENV